jgi:hypothetical protein
MTMKRTITVAAVALALTPAWAMAGYRAATPEERSAIEQVLRAEGYTAWTDIMWDDDNYWEVDDARGPDNREYEVMLDADLNIIGKIPD